jgi:hypothetical protein
MANRQNFDRATRIAIAKRATRHDGQMACELCGAVGVRLELNHRVMDAIKSDETKAKCRLTADDGELICEPCHKAITAGQRTELARVDAAAARHLGVHKPTTPMKSRPKPDKPPPRERAAGMSEIARRFGLGG